MCIEALGIGCNSSRLFFSFLKKQISHPSSRLLNSPGGEGGGVLPYISHISMCAPKGMVFALLLSENRYRLCSFWSGIKYAFQGSSVSV